MAELLGLVPGWQEQALSIWVLNSVVPIVIKMAGQRPFHGTADNGGMLISYRESLCCDFFFSGDPGTYCSGRLAKVHRCRIQAGFGGFVPRRRITWIHIKGWQ